jgi:DHA1 family bicyclomycin/chloramphenicol resistance-like MFS transporter
LSLESHGAIAGTASALMGALQFVVGAAVMAVSGLFADGAPKPMVIGIAISALVALVIARFTLRTENARLPAAAE